MKCPSANNNTNCEHYLIIIIIIIITGVEKLGALP